MARLKHNGFEHARFAKTFHREETDETIKVEHSIRVKTFKTKPAEVIILEKRLLDWPSRFSRPSWGPWKKKATARSVEGAIKWHLRREWVCIKGFDRVEPVKEEMGLA